MSNNVRVALHPDGKVQCLVDHVILDGNTRRAENADSGRICMMKGARSHVRGSTVIVSAQVRDDDAVRAVVSGATEELARMN